MKTIEEKAKAYDEIIERAQTMLAAGEVMYGKENNASQLITDLIPELCESEDERMMRVIGLALTDVPEERFTSLGTTLKDCLAYLEKQEQKPISSCDIVPYIDDAIAALQDMWREEKVAFDWDDMHEMIEDVARHFYQKEQKPVLTAKEAWKEMRLEVYAQASGNRHEPNCSDDSTKMFSLCDIDEIIEKIGDSIVGQKPAWSEEEKDNISILLCMIDSMDSISLPSGTLRISGEKRRELKEFINRPSRKLSEDQIYTLERICSNLHLRASDDAPKLDEIIELLKQK